jgi:hypothetical protein
MTDYDMDYFENGVQKRISGYTSYHWRPEYVLPLANKIKEKYGYLGKVLDYGCAKGYLVKALRLLSVEAYGYDISEYAIQTADPKVKEYCSTTFPTEKFDMVIAKDVLEHVPKDVLDIELKKIYDVLDPDWSTFIAIVPLGDNDVFRIREYELDKTHVNKEDEQWWIERFEAAGFTCDEFYYDFSGAKDHWLKVNPFGNGTFILRKK